MNTGQREDWKDDATATSKDLQILQNATASSHIFCYAISIQLNAK